MQTLINIKQKRSLIMALDLLQYVRTLLRKGNDLNDAVHETAAKFKLSDQTRFDLMLNFL